MSGADLGVLDEPVKATQTIDRNYYFYCEHQPAGGICQCPKCSLAYAGETPVTYVGDKATNVITPQGEIKSVNTPEVRAGMRGHKMVHTSPAAPELDKILEKARVEVAEKIRKFETGATRDTDNNKFDYEAFFCPLVLERRAAYMHKHRVQPDGSLRAGDNWQKGIPLEAYAKSEARHHHQFWKLHRGYEAFDEKGNPISMEDAICAAMFNLEGYLHEILKGKQ